MSYEDLTGQRFFRLIAMAPTEERRHGNVVWECKCDCGSVVRVSANHLKKGDTKSCGCWNRDVKVARNIARTKHGQAKTYSQSPTYKAWVRMIARCENPKNQNYEYYGGRGITVDPRWRSSFSNFLEDMGERPEGLTLDRKDPLKGYGPDNCQWATQFEQGKNRTTNVYLTLGEETLIMSDWVRRLGCKISALRMRLSKGWSVERALTEPFEYRTPRKSNGPKLVSDASDRARFKSYYGHLYRSPEDDLTFEQWQGILEKYTRRCAYCGNPDAKTMDHVTPISKGGFHTASNVVPSCRSCNSKKGQKSL